MEDMPKRSIVWPRKAPRGQAGATPEWPMNDLVTWFKIGEPIDSELIKPGKEAVLIQKADLDSKVFSGQSITDLPQVEVNPLHGPEKTYLRANTILLSLENPRLHPILVKSPIKAVLGPGLMALQVDETKILAEFLCTQLRSRRFLGQVERESENFPSTVEDIVKLRVEVPDLKEQKKRLSENYVASRLISEISLVSNKIDVQEVLSLFYALVFVRYLNRATSAELEEYGLDTLSEEIKWVRISNSPDIKNHLRDALAALQSVIPKNNASSTFLFDLDFFQNRLKGGLYGLVQIASSFDDSDFSYAELYERMTQIVVTNEREAAQYFMPQELATFIIKLLPAKQNLLVYNPFAGAASFGVQLPDGLKYFGQEMNSKLAQIAALRLLFHKKTSDSVLAAEDSVNQWMNGFSSTPDLIVSNPPFRLKFPASVNGHWMVDSWLLSKTIDTLKENGQAFYIMPNSVLFSQGKLGVVRKDLVKGGYVKMVIALPQGLFQSTGIATNLLVIEKTSKTKDVLFVDASECYRGKKLKNRVFDVEAALHLLSTQEQRVEKRSVSIEEIAEQKYDLSINRYLSPDPEFEVDEKSQLVSLKEILSSSKGAQPSENGSGKVIGIKDLIRDEREFEKDFEDIEEVPFSNIKISPMYRSLQSPAILFALIGGDLKPTYFNGDKIYYHPSRIACFELDVNRVDPAYLVNEIRKDYVGAQLAKLWTGAAQKFIRRESLHKIEIVLPDLQGQRSEVLRLRLHQLKLAEELGISKLQERRTEYGQEQSVLRHEIAGTLKNARRTFQILQELLASKVSNNMEGLYDLKKSPSSKLSLGRCLEIVERDLQSITRSVQRAGREIELSDYEPEEINVIKFCREYAAEIRSRSESKYQVDFTFDEETLKENHIKEVHINGDPDLLRKMYDNLVRNAEQHGFAKGSDSKATEGALSFLTPRDGLKKLRIKLAFNFKEQQIQVDVSNTGQSVPEGFTLEKFIRNGGKGGSNAGNGYGGHFINEVMKLHGGELYFTDETGPEGLHDEYASTFELKFPLILK